MPGSPDKSKPRSPSGPAKRGGVPTEPSPAILPATAPRQRLRGEERERVIAQEAVRFFAEVGFDGDTRELARRLGVTQSLIFRYFPTKKALVDRVYQEVYVGRWNPYWESVVADRSIPLQDRLDRLYKDYARTALTWDWVRIFMFSGLRGEDINKRYLGFLRSRILEPVAAEVRAELGLPSPQARPLLPEEIELVWGMSARIFYFGQRQWIFDVPLEQDLDHMISVAVAHFVAGARVVVPALLASSGPLAPNSGRGKPAAARRRVPDAAA